MARYFSGSLPDGSTRGVGKLVKPTRRADDTVREVTSNVPANRQTVVGSIPSPSITQTLIRGHPVLIFTPRRSFEHKLIQTINVLPAVMGVLAPVPARLTIHVAGDVFVFKGAEAFDVLDQLAQAGAYTEAQRASVAAALRDEMELESAGR